MFKKLNKLNIRKRRDTDEDISDDTGSYSKFNNITVNNGKNVIEKKPSENTSSIKKEKPKKSKEPKKVSLLSFDDAEEDDTTEVKLKKSSRSRRIAKEIKKRSQLEKEALNNPSTANSNKSWQEETIQSFHEFKSKQNIQSNTNVAGVFHSKKSEEPRSIPNLNPGVIPTPSMIHAARKQREMLRKFGSEHISAEDTQKFKETGKSRLIREDDDDYDSDNGIVEMKGIIKKESNASKKYVPDQSEDEDDKEDEDNNPDEEVNRWEEEIIKKGINVPTNQSVPSSNALMDSQNLLSATYASLTNNFYNPDQNKNNQFAYRHVEAKTNISFEMIKKRLEDHLGNIKQRNRSHKNEMDQLVFETTECENMSKNLQDIKSISAEYQFYQEMRDYVRDLVGCLRENVKNINILEQNVYTLWKNQSDRFVSRRRQDIQDECIQVSSKSNSDKNPSPDSEYIQRVREREARRTRRRAARQIEQSNAGHYDGLSTDDEDTTMDLAHHNTELEKIRTSAAAVFDDVLDDFCMLQNILQRFETWRSQHNSSYNDAYIALCIPKLLFPFIRQKLILWNPFLFSTTHFEEEEWFQNLSVFGLKFFPEDVQEESSNVLDDTKVLSSVIEKVLAVKLNYFIQNVWDPMSTQQSVKLSLLLKELSRDYPFMTAENHQCQRLVQSLCKRLQNAVDNDIFIPLLPMNDSNSPAHAFLERQTWSSIKLFKNIMLFDSLLSYQILCEIAFDSVLNRYILLALQTSVMNVSCLYKCQKIVDSIPKQWLNQHENLHSHLSSLARFLVHFAQSIKASGLINSKTMLKQIKTMLLVIGARDALLQL